MIPRGYQEVGYQLRILDDMVTLEYTLLVVTEHTQETLFHQPLSSWFTTISRYIFLLILTPVNYFHFLECIEKLDFCSSVYRLLPMNPPSVTRSDSSLRKCLLKRMQITTLTQ